MYAFVSIRKDSSELDIGIPQGSVLGPTFYSVYTKSISDIIRKFNQSYRSYADDVQLYISIENHSNMDNLSAVVENCVHEIKSWMQYDVLKLNDDKAELAVCLVSVFPI